MLNKKIEHQFTTSSSVCSLGCLSVMMCVHVTPCAVSYLRDNQMSVASFDVQVPFPRH